MNQLWINLTRGEISLDEHMKFYMQIGYSLGGFCEVYGQHEVTEFGLEYHQPPLKQCHIGDEYWETPIQWLLKEHAGKVLKL